MKIAVLPGDGIGPEIIAQARAGSAEAGPDASSSRRRRSAARPTRRRGDPLPAATLALAKEADAILFGAVGDPHYDKLERAKRPEQAILGLRKELGLFANLRPAQVYPELADASALKPEVVAGLDILIVRELTGDIYFGEPQGHPARSRRDAKASTPCATARPRSGASRASPSRRRASAASGSARWTRRTCSRPRSSGEKSSPQEAQALSRRRAVAHVRRQLRDAAGAQSEAVRRHRHRQHVRRHPVRRGLDADRLDRHAALGLARREAARACTSRSTAPRRTSPARASPIRSRPSCRRR